MRNIKLILEYDGTNYRGWQKQKNGKTIQGEVERAVGEVTKEESIEVIGCSRTDSGVHSRAYTANFSTNSSIPGEKFLYAINNKLPKDIVVTFSEEVEEKFHSRYNSKGKTYCYTILNRRVPSAIHRNYVYLVKDALDLDLIIEGAKYFEGTHDFEAFRTLGSSVKTTVRTIHRVKIEKEEDLIKIYVTGDGFLYNMVRIMVGTLIEVGRKKINPGEIKNIIDKKDRKLAGIVVPPMGLELLEVFY
ncbi:tRNA pseudouridine(38-40) synthase TruA [Clostridium hydrogeniformans]|uniref:tRNA pseudouridine(38-40) synthase TruA n=1 Tax=Clostridium hydrogeniformans TaxID=349933 RepID=UPI000486D24D|nr:tRNA pseudouridine(38-40) synthase TruA [Clostridium hydrogeniformans]